MSYNAIDTGCKALFATRMVLFTVEIAFDNPFEFAEFETPFCLSPSCNAFAVTVDGSNPSFSSADTDTVLIDKRCIKAEATAEFSCGPLCAMNRSIVAVAAGIIDCIAGIFVKVVESHGVGVGGEGGGLYRCKRGSDKTRA